MPLGVSLFVFAIAVLLEHASFAATSTNQKDSQPRSLSEEVARALAIYAPKPRYPYEARAKYLAGAGVARLDVDPQTGSVISAKMVQTTGHKILDDAALEAFRQWRFKPGTVHKVNIPITFALRGVPAGGVGGKALALYAARPSYPAEARSKRWTGTGIVLVEVDQNTGQVTSARMLQSTGHQILDDAALRAFRQWRFKPGTRSKIRIPITFSMAGVTY